MQTIAIEVHLVNLFLLFTHENP